MHPEITTSLHLLGLSYTAMDDYARAYRAVRDWTLAAPEDPRAHDAAGYVQLLWNRGAEAQEAFGRAAISRGDGADLPHQWMLWILDEDWDELAAWLDEEPSAITKIERASVAQTRAIACLYLGQARRALEILEDATQDAEGSRPLVELLPFVARLHLELGDPEQALLVAERTIAAAEGDRAEWAGRFEAALAQHRLGLPQLEQNIALLEQRTAALPTLREESRTNLLRGRLALLDGHMLEAEKYLLRAQALLSPRSVFWEGQWSPLHTPVWEMLGVANLEMGRYDEALAWFDQVAEGGAQRLTWPVSYQRTLYRLGQTHEALGQDHLAKAYYERFLETWSNSDLDREWVEEADKRIR